MTGPVSIRAPEPPRAVAEVTVRLLVGPHDRTLRGRVSIGEGMSIATLATAAALEAQMLVRRAWPEPEGIK